MKEIIRGGGKTLYNVYDFDLCGGADKSFDGSHLFLCRYEFPDGMVIEFLGFTF